MPVHRLRRMIVSRPDGAKATRFGKWSVEMIEVFRSGAIIMMGLSVMCAAVAVMVYG
jgi:hypothetical protein